MRSIFLEPQYENKYELKKVFTRYENEIVIRSEKYWVENKEIYVCDIDRPLLEIEEMFFLQHINRYVTIQRVIRTSENEVIYLVEDTYFTTEEEKNHKIELEKELLELDEYKKTIKEKDEEIYKLKDNLNHISSVIYKKWIVFTKDIKKFL